MKLKLVPGSTRGSAVCTAPFGITGATVVGSSLILIIANRADSKALNGDEAAKLSATVARLIRAVK